MSEDISEIRVKVFKYGSDLPFIVRTYNMNVCDFLEELSKL